MRFFTWNSYLQEMVPKPDDRIYGIRIGLMDPRELSVAKRCAQGRFCFGILAVAFVTFSVMLVCSTKIHEASNSADLPYFAAMLINGVVATLRIIYVYWERSVQYKLIDQEIERRQFDKAGKYC